VVPLALHIEAMTGSPLPCRRSSSRCSARSSRSAARRRLADRFENARLLWSVSLAQAAVVAAMALATGSLAAVLCADRAARRRRRARPAGGVRPRSRGRRRAPACARPTGWSSPRATSG
jgi:hypothetical protein